MPILSVSGARERASEIAASLSPVRLKDVLQSIETETWLDSQSRNEYVRFYRLKFTFINSETYEKVYVLCFCFCFLKKINNNMEIDVVFSVQQRRNSNSLSFISFTISIYHHCNQL